MKDRMLNNQRIPIAGERPLGVRELQNWKRFFRDAVNIAFREHLMKTWKGMSYQVHLDRTVDVLEDFGYGDNTIDGWRRKVGMVFHDMIEDCGWTFNDVKAVGDSSCGISEKDAIHVASIAYALTDEKGKNRDERKPPKLYKEMAAHQDFIINKLADRIVNREQDGSMGKKYNKEYEPFRAKLYKKGMCDNLWAYVDQLHGYKVKKKK